MDGKQIIDVPVLSPDEIRNRIAVNRIESRLLRSLLKVSERTTEVRDKLGRNPELAPLRAAASAR